jgi:hypothetical protein
MTRKAQRWLSLFHIVREYAYTAGNCHRFPEASAGAITRHAEMSRLEGPDKGREQKKSDRQSIARCVLIFSNLTRRSDATFVFAPSSRLSSPYSAIFPTFELVDFE